VKFLSALLAVSSVAGVVAPSVSVFAAATDVQTLVDNAKRDKTFYSFNVAYGAIIALPEAEQGKYLAEIAPLEATVRTSKIDTILRQIDSFYATQDMSIYDYVLYKLIPEVPDQIDREYLQYELGKWGQVFIVREQPEYIVATDAIIAVDTALQAGKIEEARALIPAAEAAIANVKHGANNKYLSLTTLPEVVTRLNAADKVAPFINVSDSKFTDYKTIKIALSEKVTGTPEVKINGTVEPAANVILSADGLSLTVTRSAGFVAANYTVVVNGLKDAAGNAMLADATVQVKKDASYLKNFAFTTIGLPNLASQKVYFTAADQYGEDVTSNMSALDNNLTVTGTMGTFPLSVSHADGDAFITIADTLTKASNVSITLTNKDADGKVVGTATSPVYTVSDTVPAATSISSISINNSTQTSGTTAIALTANVKDQYGNPYTFAAGEKLRWTTSDKTVVAFNSDSTKDFMDGNANSNTIAVDAKVQGSAIIQAFLQNGTPVTAPLAITVNQGTLDEIITTGANITVGNNATVTSANVAVNAASGTTLTFENSLNNKISMKAADVVLSVKDANGTDAAAVVSLVKVVDEYGNLTGIKVATNRADQSSVAVAGNPNKVYTVTVAAAEKSATFTVTSTIDTVIKTIEVSSIPANSLTAGGSYVVPVTFKNQYGEVIEVKENGTNNLLQFSNLSGVTLTDAKDADGTAAGSGEVISHIMFTGNTAGTYNSFIATGNASLQIPVTVAAAGKLNTMTLGNSTVSVIADDTLDLATPVDTDNIVVVGGSTYTLVPVSFKDNYGNAVAVKYAAAGKVTVGNDSTQYDWNVTGADNLAISYFQKADGTFASSAGEEIKYIGVREDNLVDATATRNVVFEVKDSTPTTLATANLTVNVTAARTLTSLAVTPNSGSAVVGAVMNYTIAGLDQYGRAVNLDEANVQLQTLANVSLDNVVANSTDANKVDFTLSASAAGSYTAKVFYSTDATLDSNEKSIDLPFVVGEVGSMIDHLAIQPSLVYDDDTTPGSSVSYDGSKYMVKVAADDADQNITFATKAYDANNNEVAFNSSDVIYSVVSVTPAQNGTLTAGDLSFNGNVLTINSDTHNVIDGDKIVVKATSVNGKSTTFTVTLGVSANTAQLGKYYLAKASATDKAITSITLNDEDVNGVEEIVLVGIDQYGKQVNITENASNVVIGQDSAAYFTKAADADSINVTAKAVGSSTLRVFVDGNQEGIITITVDQNAVNAAKKAAALVKIAAYATDNTNAAPTVEDYTAAGVTGVTTSNLAAVNAAVDALTGANVDTTTEVQAVVNGLL
jgi:hypothetical protein